MAKRRAIYSNGQCVVIVCHSRDTGEVYYTVVNTVKQVHRHTKYRKQATMLCKYAGRKLVPDDACDTFKRQVLYLIYGDVAYK